MFQTYMGGALSFKPHPQIRITAAAGPVFTYASLDWDDDDVDDNGVIVPGGPNVIIIEDRDHDANFGLYTKLSISFQVSREFSFGLVYREQNLEMDFNDSIGEVDFDSEQVMLYLGYSI